jgi:hypothetical protein
MGKPRAHPQSSVPKEPESTTDTTRWEAQLRPRFALPRPSGPGASVRPLRPGPSPERRPGPELRDLHLLRQPIASTRQAVQLLAEGAASFSMPPGD